MKTIRNTGTILFFTILIALVSCNFRNKQSDPVWSDLPVVTSLSDLKQTDFVPTLENPIGENKNIIYASTLLYAWDKIKVELKFPIIDANTSSSDFKLLNQSNSHQNSLTDTEYSATVAFVDGTIIARAFFNKTLPFETKLQLLEDPILFDTTKVSAFGMYYYNEDVLKTVKILYYEDDNNFILQLLPKDKQHEIILVKTLRDYQTFKDAIKFMDSMVDNGKREQMNPQLSWKYQIVNNDIFSIPTVKFNIEKHFKSLEGQNFYTNDKKKYFVDDAYQRTGFILNENGAVATSEVIVTTDSASAVSASHPKRMIFDKPFLIIIKRVGKTNPYFVMKVANTELLTRK